MLGGDSGCNPGPGVGQSLVMQNRSRSILREILPAEDRAIEAVVARYQRVAPAITRFARSLSGNDQLRVRLGSETMADQNEVVVDPRLFQAAYSRDAPVTPNEVALASALHEVVHLVSTDLDEARPLPEAWLPADHELVSDQPMRLLDALTEVGGYVAEALFFSVEDARQERQGMGAYPGARSVLSDLYVAATQGALREASLFGQYALAVFLLIGGHTDREWLEKRMHPAPAGALADATPFVGHAIEAGDPWEAGEAALGLLAVARSHGLVTKVEESETPSAAKRQLDEEGQAMADTVDMVRLFSPAVQDAETYERTRRASEARAGQEGRLGDAEVAGNSSTDQLVRVSEAPTVYLPTGQSGKLIVSPIPDRFRRHAAEGAGLLGRAADEWGVEPRRVSGELYPLFVANQRRGLRSGFDAGDLSPHAALFLGAGLYQRLYERRELSTRRAYAVSLLIDGSASMLQPRPLGTTGRSTPWGLAAATLGAWTLARLADELQLDFEVALFNRSFAASYEDTEASYVQRRSGAVGGLRRTHSGAADRLTNTINHYLIKTFDQPWRQAEPLVSGLFWAAAEPKKAEASARRNPGTSPPVSMFSKAANVDEFNLTYAAERMAKRRSQVRVLIVLADGMTRGSVGALESAVQSVEHAGTTVLGIGIGDATVEAAYDRAEVVGEPSALTEAMIRGTRATLHRSLALRGIDAWWARAGRQHDRERELIRA